jgi:hypothetical protein
MLPIFSYAAIRERTGWFSTDLSGKHQQYPDRVTRLAASPDTPITVVHIHYVKEGCEPQFEAEIKKHMSEFSSMPGNLGVSIFRPGKYHDGVYRVVYKFASQEDLDRWHASPPYLTWMKTEEKLTIAPSQMKVLTGLETWFTLPGQNVLKPPTKARQAVVTWIAALPVSIIISLITNPFLDSQPFLVQKVVFVTLLVVLLNWVVMPLATQLFAQWLFPSENHSSGADPTPE